MARFGWVLLLCGCVSTVNVNKPQGDRAGVELRQGPLGAVELLGVDDTFLYFDQSALLCRARLADVARVNVAGYSLKTDRAASAVLLIGYGGLMTAALAASMTVVALLPAAWTAATGYFVLTGDRDLRTDFRSPFEPQDREQLRLYCRYPQGLTQDQWRELVRQHAQIDFLDPVPLTVRR